MRACEATRIALFQAADRFFERGELMTVHIHTKLEVVVHYIAAEHPLKEEAVADETVGQLKTRVLKAFGLAEGQTPDGNTVIYILYHHKAPLENPNQPLAEVACHEHV